MSTLGKNSKSVRKKTLGNERKLILGVKTIVFAHEAAAGEDVIDLTALVAPSEMVGNGFVQPGVADLTAANIKYYRANLEIVSSYRGLLTDFVDYRVLSTTQIQFIGFTTVEGEIFVCKMRPVVKSGLLLADTRPLVVTGELAIGESTINVGTPFKVNEYASQQIGAVMVVLGGRTLLRNTGNNAPGVGVEGDYREVLVAGGYGTTIELNDPVTIATGFAVISTAGLVERPNESLQAMIETLGGQIDAMVPVLADAAGVPTTTFQTNPNEINLRQFGDTVFDHETRIADLEDESDKIVWLKDVKSAGTDGGTFTSGSWQTRTLNTLENAQSWISLLSNQFTLQPGKYEIEASAPALATNGHKAKIRNITDSVDEILGSSEDSGTTSSETTTSRVTGILTVVTAKTYELQHRCSVTAATFGFGIAVSLGVSEVYAQVKVRKLA